MTWHNCDGTIGRILRYASRPHKHFNNGRPTWFIYLAGGQKLPMAHCPICGEELPEMTDGGYACEICGHWVERDESHICTDDSDDVRHYDAPL